MAQKEDQVIDEEKSDEFKIREPKDKEDAIKIWKDICSHINTELADDYVKNVKLLIPYLTMKELFDLLEHVDQHDDGTFEHYLCTKREMGTMKTVVVESFSSQIRIENANLIIEKIGFQDDLDHLLKYLKDDKLKEVIDKLMIQKKQQKDVISFI
jgi:hypothetical protein